MKQINLIITITAFILISSGCAKKDNGHGHSHHGHSHHGHSHDGHSHHGHSHSNQKKDLGPNGGRILKTMTPELEFFVREDRRVQITALKDHKAIPVNGLTATLTGGDRINPPTLTFTKEGDILVSDKPLPEGDNIPVILQIKNTPDATPVKEKIQVNLSGCSTCEYREYACICNHQHGHQDYLGDHKHH